MDGLSMTVPYSERPREMRQISLFEFISAEGVEVEDEIEAIPCKVHDWRAKVTLEYRSLLHK